MSALPRAVDNHIVLVAIMLTVLAVIGERYPLHLTHKTSINVASAAYFAMVLVLPVSLPGILALVAISIGAQLRRGHATLTFPENFFNVSQGALYTSASALLFAVMEQHAIGPKIGEIGAIFSVMGAAVAMHVVNTAAVAGAAGLQLGVSPLRVWWRNLALDLTPHVTLTVVGVLAAMIALSDSYWLLPFLALPGVLVQRAVQETIQLRADTNEALAALVEVVELRDPYTAGHSRRVASSSRLIAEQLGLTHEEADVIENAGRVHDIGKVAIDPGILLKTSKLDPHEWAEMELHPVYGANIVDRFTSYREGAKFVRHHHERWDGTGYPDKIAEEEIPLGARILAVADSFDAMTSDRPYREGMQVDRALAIIAAGAGTQWDPKIVDAFLKVVQSRGGEVPIFRRNETSASVRSSIIPGEAPESRTAPKSTSEAA